MVRTGAAGRPCESGRGLRSPAGAGRNRVGVSGRCTGPRPPVQCGPSVRAVARGPMEASVRLGLRRGGWTWRLQRSSGVVGPPSARAAQLSAWGLRVCGSLPLPAGLTQAPLLDFFFFFNTSSAHQQFHLLNPLLAGACRACLQDAPAHTQVSVVSVLCTGPQGAPCTHPSGVRPGRPLPRPPPRGSVRALMCGPASSPDALGPRRKAWTGESPRLAESIGRCRMRREAREAGDGDHNPE